MIITANNASDGGTFIGIAGWNIPKVNAAAFTGIGTHLERYAARFGAVEINSSFYRSHRRATYVRWAASVPDAFRFSVKLPKTITHVARMRGCADLAAVFAEDVSGLGSKLGTVLAQLPPSLAFDAAIAAPFLRTLRNLLDCAIVIEPRHASWSQPSAIALLIERRIARRRRSDSDTRRWAACGMAWRAIQKAARITAHLPFVL